MQKYWDHNAGHYSQNYGWYYPNYQVFWHTAPPNDKYKFVLEVIAEGDLSKDLIIKLAKKVLR